jgi:hypothetical protein
MNPPNTTQLRPPMVRDTQFELERRAKRLVLGLTTVSTGGIVRSSKARLIPIMVRPTHTGSSIPVKLFRSSTRLDLAR